MQTRRLNRSATVLLGTLVGLVWGIPASSQLIYSEKDIERQARTQWLMLQRQQAMHPDERIQRYVTCVANLVIATLDDEWQNMAWETVVIDADDPNAYVLPIGKIIVHSGLLRVADTQDALGAVIGHEIAHLTQNHVLERARRTSMTSAASIIGSRAIGVGRDTVQSGAMIGLQLPYQREQESEADRVGLQYMAQAGFDPRAALDLWKNMKAKSEADGRERPASFLLTHPTETQRLDDMVPLLVQNLRTYNEARAAGKSRNCYAVTN